MGVNTIQQASAQLQSLSVVIFLSIKDTTLTTNDKTLTTSLPTTT